MSTQMYLGIGILVLYGLVKFGPWLWSKVPAFKAAPIVTPDTDDALDIAAFNRLKARSKRMGCKAGLAALKVYGTHFLADHEEEITRA